MDKLSAIAMGRMNARTNAPMLTRAQWYSTFGTYVFYEDYETSYHANKPKPAQ